MKNCTLIIIFFFGLSSADAKLKNGYEKDIHFLRDRLEKFNAHLSSDTNLPAIHKRNIKDGMKELEALQSYYAMTEQLLQRFKMISPNLYNRIDSITDAKGGPTDVYVKFIPREETLVMAGGLTYMAQSTDDKGVCFSEYGKQTVSVKIWIFSKALHALAHELGHIYYQVPNLESYIDFYKHVYRPYSTEANHLGHAPYDRSGVSAMSFEKEFRKDYIHYLKSNHRMRVADNSSSKDADNRLATVSVGGLLKALR
ncbi:MAG TPA: hypothetical protein VFZ52_17440 [Chryseolinea sp.]